MTKWDGWADALLERDRLLTAGDVEGMKVFLATYGSSRVDAVTDWTVVLQLARHYQMDLPEAVRRESDAWLMERFDDEHPLDTGPNFDAAFDLVFPDLMFGSPWRHWA